MPNGPGAVANFSGAGSLANVNVNGAKTLGQLVIFNSTADVPYVISAGSLYMDNAGAHALIISSSPVTQTINALVVTTADSPLDVNAYGGSLLNLPGGIDNSLGTTVTLRSSANSTLSVGTIINHGTLRVTGEQASTQLGPISGNGILTLDNNNDALPEYQHTLTLAQPSTYTGGTSVSGGIMLLNNSSGSATGTGIVAITGGTIGGHGVITGLLDAHSGNGTIAPSATLPATTTGTLTVGALTTGPDATLYFHLVSPNAVDLINVTNSGGLTVNGGHIKLIGSPDLDTYYKLIQYNGSIAGAGAFAFRVDPMPANSGYFFDLEHDPGFIDIYLTNVATWDSANANWSDAPHWSTNPIVPTTNAHSAAMFSGNVNLDISPTIRNFSLSGGSLAGTGTLTVSNLFHWDGGSIGGEVIVEGSMDVTGPNSLTLPTAPPNFTYLLDLTHDPGFIDLHKVLLGDANADNIVDGSDFDLWFSHLGQSATNNYSSGDLNADNLIDGADFDLWFSHLQNTFGTADNSELRTQNSALLPIPEPTTALLLIPLTLLVTRRRR